MFIVKWSGPFHGPRQVGKTTTCRMEGTDYLNWDNADDRRLILRGPAAVAARIQLEQLRKIRPIVVYDELHKDKKWKAFLKGFFDVYGERTRIIVTGSSRLDVYRRGSDSLLGRKSYTSIYRRMSFIRRVR